MAGLVEGVEEREDGTLIGGGPGVALHHAALRGGSTAIWRLDVKTLWCYLPGMPTLKRATVYFDPALHRALRIKAASTERSLSNLVNAAIRESLAEDAEDLAAFAARAKEPSLAFEDVLKDLKRRGKL